MPCTRRAVLACLAATAWPAGARPAPPALMLARDAPEGIDPAGFLVSEKLDGARAVWDGRQLRFRSGHAVPAPAWFTARLPDAPLDGELWLGRSRFEALMGTVREQVPVDAEWRAVQYRVFDQPGTPGPFSERTARLQALVQAVGWPALSALEQQRVPDRAALQRKLQQVVAAGGEGLMLHRAAAPWRPGRSDDLLKLKPLADAEAVVIGHELGRGRHEGRLGALRVRTEGGIEFLIGTGFSDAERAAPPPLGAVVTFSYRGRTANGVPRFASFVRVRADA